MENKREKQFKRVQKIGKALSEAFLEADEKEYSFLEMVEEDKAKCI